MHIMFVPSWYSNNRNKVHGSFFKEQALAIQDKGVKVSIAYNEIWPLTMLGRVNEKIGLNVAVEEGIKTYRYKNFNFIPKHNLMFKIFNRRMEFLYNEIVRREGKVDVIHAQSSLWGGISAAYVAKKYGIPLIITEHSSVEKGVYIKESYKPIIKLSYNIADKLIVVGNGLKNELKEFSGRNDIEVVHNLIPLDLFSVKEYAERNDFTFFSLAFLEGEKGMDTLIKAFAKGFAGTDCKLNIGGDGSQKNGLIELTKKLGVYNQVRFLGALSRRQVAKYMSECDVFVLASKHETFGVVYIEALASGKPIIGTYNGGAEDIVNDENGLLVNIDDVDGLELAMKKIKANIKIYDKFKIRKNCELRFSKDVIGERIIDIYKEVTNDKI